MAGSTVMAWSSSRKLPRAWRRRSRCWSYTRFQSPTLSSDEVRCPCQNHTIFSCSPAVRRALEAEPFLDRLVAVGLQRGLSAWVLGRPGDHFVDDGGQAALDQRLDP